MDFFDRNIKKPLGKRNSEFLFPQGFDRLSVGQERYFTFSGLPAMQTRVLMSPPIGHHQVQAI